MTPDDLRARVLYQDGNVLVLDKPAGLAVHPGPRTPQSLEALLGALTFGRPQPPGLAHRLDRDTSGCLILGRDHRALRKLGRLFTAGGVEKTYWAVVQGAPPADAGRIELPLRKVNRREGWHIETDPAGQRAVTDYRVLATAPGIALLELRPRTGRTHQVRVHCAALGCPILGDPVYGTPAPDVPVPPLHLHARAVVVPYYAERPPLSVTAPLPPHMRTTLRAHGLTAEGAA